MATDAENDLTGADLIDLELDAELANDGGDEDATDGFDVRLDAGHGCDRTVEVARDPDVLERTRSIGTAGVLTTTRATVSVGSDVVCLDDPLPPEVGVGDQLRFGAGSLFVFAVIDETTVVVDAPALDDYAAESVTIQRAYATIQRWEDERGGDLVAGNRREIGVLYDDSTFTAGAVISGSVTDPSRYMHLTVAPRSRHDGTAGTGVVIEPAVASHGLQVVDDWTRVSWVEVTRWSVGVAASLDGINVLGTGVEIDHVIIHDDGATAGTDPDCNGITAEQDGIAVRVTNSIVYSIARSAFAIHDTASTLLEVFNSTAWNCKTNDGLSLTYGCVVLYSSPGSTLVARNVLAGGAVAGLDFSQYPDGPDQFVGSSNNISSDASAPGPNSLTGFDPATFVSVVPRAEDLHLLPSAIAIDAGTDLSVFLTDDIDGEPRPKGLAFDVGADEF